MAVLLWAGPAVASEARSADLDKAAKLVFEQRYEAAARLLEAASRQTGNKRDTVLRILELQGVTWAQLGQDAKAKLAFQTLISLDPKRELSGKYGAKVLKPFSDAQAWSMDNPPLEVSAEPAAVDPAGKVLQIAVKVKNDALKLARKVRFSVRSDGKWSEQLVELQGAYASAGTDSDAIEWWAEVLGERDMVLAQIGSARTPVKEGKLREKEPPPVASAGDMKAEEPKQKDTPRKGELDPPPREAPPGEQLAEPERTPTPEPESSGNAGVRAVGYASLALGMVSLVAGTVAGGLWRNDVATFNDKLANAERNGDGDIVRFPGVTGSAQAYDLGMRERIRNEAIAANVLWGVGGGLAILGIILYFAGRETADVQPGAGGLVVSW